MRDNSGIDNLTKVNAQTSFQPKYTFKMESKCVMIQNMFVAFSVSTRGLWQFWSLQGLLLMTSNVAQNKDWFDFIDAPNEEPINETSKFNWFTWLRSSGVIDSLNLKISKKQVTFAEIFNHSSLISPLIVEFNTLVESIRLARKVNQSITFSDRDDSSIFEAIVLLSNIINLHWEEFSLENKVLLLAKLQKFNKSKESFLIELILKSLLMLPKKLVIYLSYILEFFFADRQLKQSIGNKADINLKLIFNALFKLLEVTQMIFQKDGKLFKQNRDNINKFAHNLRVEIWENETLEAAHQACEVVRSGRFKRQTLDEFKASLLSYDEG